MDNKVSIFTKIISLFWEPTKTFEAISKKVNALDIIIPIVLLSIVGMITVPYVTPIAIDAQKAKIEQSDKISDEQKQEILNKMDEKKSPIIGYIITPIAIIFGMVIMTLVLWFLGNFILGGDRKFMDIWGLVAYGSLIDLVASAVKIPLMVQKGSMDVYTSLAIFMNDSSTFLFRFVKTLDIFSIWKMVVFAIGLSVFYKKKLNKSLIIMFSAWIIYCLLSATLTGLIKV